jgi:hypothetical protein
MLESTKKYKIKLWICSLNRRRMFLHRKYIKGSKSNRKKKKLAGQ